MWSIARMKSVLAYQETQCSHSISMRSFLKAETARINAKEFYRLYRLRPSSQVKISMVAQYKSTY
jgi:hypothetical protein